MVQPFGRPREHDRKQLADDLIEWAMLEDSLNLCGFAALKLIPPRKIWQFSVEDDYFREAYDLAKAMIGERRDKMLNAKLLATESYKLNAHVYDYFMKQEHRDDLEFQSKLKNEETKSVPDDIRDTFTALMSQVSSRQSTSKSDLTKSNIDK